MKRTEMIGVLEELLTFYKRYKVEEEIELSKEVVASIYTASYLVDKYKRDKRKNITALEAREVSNAYMASVITVAELALSSEMGIADLNDTIEKLLERY